MQNKKAIGSLDGRLGLRRRRRRGDSDRNAPARELLGACRGGNGRGWPWRRTEGCGRPWRWRGDALQISMELRRGNYRALAVGVAARCERPWRRRCDADLNGVLLQLLASRRSTCRALASSLTTVGCNCTHSGAFRPSPTGISGSTTARQLLHRLDSRQRGGLGSDACERLLSELGAERKGGG
jgi:hypothetical protein